MVAPEGVEIVPYRGLAELPYFSPDLDGDETPAPVAGLRRMLRETHALLISSPEYAHGVPGVLKNALDWLVSGPEMVGRPVALFNASPSSTHAHASLVDILTTMSAVVLREASIALPLRGRGMTAAQIAGDPTMAAVIREALILLAAAGERARDTLQSWYAP